MLRRIFGGRGPAGKEPKVVLPGARQGGHGDHWGCILRAIDEGHLISYLVDITRQDDHPETFGEGSGRGLVFRSADGPLQTCVIVTDNFLASAYPEVESGTVWPVMLREIIPWANGVEGQLVGVSYGAEVRFFDTRFYANVDKYRVGETYNFSMGALAYTLGQAPEFEAESAIGAKVSFKGASAYMPAGMSNEDADIDDYWFHSPLQGERTETTLIEQPLYAYPVIMAIPSDIELHIDIYAAEHVLAPDMALARLEDDLQGFIWLQGHLADDEEDEEEESAT